MRRIYYIAVNTFRELIRGKVLYSILFVGVLLVAIISLFGSVTVGDQARVVKDFGLFASGLQAVLFAVISGASFLEKEISKRTIWTTLSKGISRSEFLIGKYIGMVTVSVLLILLSTVLLGTFLFFLQGILDLSLLYGAWFMTLELFILCAIVMLVSSFLVTPVLVGAVSFGLFLSGRSLEYLQYLLTEEVVSGPQAQIIDKLYWILPRFSDLNITSILVNNGSEGIKADLIWSSSLYSIGYSLAVMSIACWLFNRREFP